MISIVAAKPEHAVNMKLRSHDLLEYEIAKVAPQAAIERSIREANFAWTGLVDGSPACIWGVRQEGALCGANIWLVTTPLVDKYCKTFLRLNRQIIPSILDHYGYLFAYVDENYEKSIRWLKWLGFSPAEAVEISGMVVRKFELRGY